MTENDAYEQDKKWKINIEKGKINKFLHVCKSREYKDLSVVQIFVTFIRHNASNKTNTTTWLFPAETALFDQLCSSLWTSSSLPAYLDAYAHVTAKFRLRPIVYALIMRDRLNKSGITKSQLPTGTIWQSLILRIY